MAFAEDYYGGRFDVVGESEADGRGRVALGRAGARPGRRYQVRSDDDGVILLTPVVSIPEREMLAWENPQLAEQVRTAIADAEAGRSVDLGDFTRYADIDATRTDRWRTSCASPRLRRGPSRVSSTGGGPQRSC